MQKKDLITKFTKWISKKVQSHLLSLPDNTNFTIH